MNNLPKNTPFSGKPPLYSSPSTPVAPDYIGICPPSNNMGGKTFIHASTSAINYLDNTKYHIINTPNRNLDTDPNAAFIDWVTFSFNIGTFYSVFPTVAAISDYDVDVVNAISEKLNELFGFGVTHKCERGKSNYAHSYMLGDNWGFLCIGGESQNGTCAVIINGSGCTAMRERLWQGKLVDFLIKVYGKITRVDTTADFFEGEYTVDKALEQYMAGEFDNSGPKVTCNQAGNWARPDGNGRTIYVGNKKNGKQLCVYEKGKQLGGKWATSFKDWVRVELRYGSKDRVIPLEVLLYPGQYLSAGYKPLNFISKIQCKIKTSRAVATVNYERAKAILKHQHGKLIYAVAAIEGSIKSIINDDDVPDRLKTPDIKYRVLEDIADGYAVSEDYALSMAFVS